MKTKSLLALLCILVWMAGCQATPTATPQPTSVPTAVVVTEATPLPSLAPTEQPTDAPTAAAEQPTQASAPTQVPTAEPSATPVAQISEWTPDGVVGEAEYTYTESFGSVRLYWSNDAESLYMAIQAKTKGWVAVGFKPDQRMQGADYVLGFVKDNQAQVHDGYGNAPTGSHPADDELGGTNDIVAYGGAETDGTTTIEFQIPLASGDQYDNVLEPGTQVSFIWAVGSADNFTSPHAARGTGTITLDATK